jgi:hypothetical protein
MTRTKNSKNRPDIPKIKVGPMKNLIMALLATVLMCVAVSAGKKADIIAVHGDVLEYINLLQHVDFVMKGGVVYKQNGQPL